MINNEEQSLIKALQEASPLQVHRKTDYPPMNEQLSGIFSELKQLRKENNTQESRFTHVNARKYPHHISDSVELELSKLSPIG